MTLLSENDPLEEEIPVIFSVFIAALSVLLIFIKQASEQIVESAALQEQKGHERVHISHAGSW